MGEGIEAEQIEEAKYKEEERGYIAVLAGSISDLSVLDFSPWRLSCYHINNQELKKYVQKFSSSNSFDRNWKEIDDFSRRDLNDESRYFWDSENLNVLVPTNLLQLPTEEDLWECRRALLTLFPTEINILMIHFLQVFDKKEFFCAGSMHFDFRPHRRLTNNTGNDYENYLSLAGAEITEVNTFLNLFKQRASTLQYVNTALNTYETAWQMDTIVMAFINLCICLEAVVPGAEQVTFRFRRNLAVLLGEDVDSSGIIFENARRIYNLRSKFVHSEIQGKDYKNLGIYYTYTKALASRMIVEMILHNIDSIGRLDRQLTFSGFGNRNGLSTGYNSLVGNHETVVLINNQPLP